MENPLPAIPPKRYFTIGEVSELCGVKPYVLRYWEQEFTQLRPMKRRGNRRYYQHHEVLLIRRIRDLLYEQGFTISGARNRLAELGALNAHSSHLDDFEDEVSERELGLSPERVPAPPVPTPASAALVIKPADASTAVAPAGRVQSIRDELLSIRSLLEVDF
ncbi:transcriptional regulator, MerR family [Leptothrix cholodnii SP-6]|uniref:Transcriptional regulator, MerR family n=1 Tax=Leptothrix cholodnii (strain ATCC 51168 / LMG 8142 / SP-6) TaxID=395495 RepID=B1XZ00_LEPCP|nr:MerR family transcriptional regulator [Leptothrix cholodnii]ACB34019.1 transcriptional regulator, MerR family [Leptothrix cholodnii SP-6]